MTTKGSAVTPTRSADDLLADTTRSRHENMLQVTRHRLNTLFWEIGGLLKEMPAEQIKEFAPRLESDYGAFFSEVELGKMKQVATAFADHEIVEWLAIVLNWDQLVAVSGIMDKRDQLEYIRQVVEPDGDQKDQHSWAEYGAGRMSSDQEFSKSIQVLKTRYRVKRPSGMKEVFKEPFFSLLRPLLALRDRLPETRGNQRPQPLSKTDRVYGSVSTAVDTFSQRHNSWLNSYLNFSFLEIGKTLNLLFPGKQDAADLQTVSKSLGKKMEGSFDEDNLRVASRFAAYWNDSDETLELASLVSWLHIRVLPLEQVETSLLYARLAATRRWTAEALSQQISDDVKNPKVSPIHELIELHSPVVTRTTENVEKKGNQIFTVNTVSMDIPAGTLRLNILDNPYFSLIR